MKGYAFQIIKWSIALAIVLGLAYFALDREESESWAPDFIVFIGHPDFPDVEAGIWRTSTGSFSYRVPNGSLTGIPEMVAPDPTTNRIAVVVHQPVGLVLPTILEEYRAYIWKGGEDFVFLEAVDTNIRLPLDRDVVSRQLGLNGDSWGEDFGPIPFAQQRESSSGQ